MTTTTKNIPVEFKNRRISIHLAECIERSGMSLRKICKEVDLTPATLSRIQTGKQLPNLETVQILCNYLECKLEDMVRLE